MNRRKWVLAATVVYILLMIGSMMQTINEGEMTGLDYDSYAIARARLLNGNELYQCRYCGTMGDDTFRYHPVYLVAVPPKPIFILGLFMSYLFCVFVICREGPFYVRTQFEQLILVANPLLLISAVAGNASSYLILFGFIALFLISWEKYPILAGISLLPLVLTKPHWATFFAVTLILTERKYIMKVVASVLAGYTVSSILFALVFGAEHLTDYVNFMTDGSAVQGSIDSLPTVQQGLAHWLEFLIGNSRIANAIALAVRVLLGIGFVVQIRKLLSERNELGQMQTMLYLFAFSYLTVMLMLPDMQVLELMPVVILVLYRHALRTRLVRVVFILWIILVMYPLNGIFALSFSEDSLAYAALMYILFTPVIWVNAMLQWIALWRMPLYDRRNLGA